MKFTKIPFAFTLFAVLLLTPSIISIKIWAQAPEELAGELIYSDTIQKLEEAQARNASKRDISHIYVKAAGQCRDEGVTYYAVQFFEAAISEDPDNAHAHRVYGDYLMGYRGLYEQAGTHYFRALTIIELDPEAFDDTFRESLYRSINIWHRDGQDGLPLIKNYYGDDYSLYIEPFIDYSKPSADKDEYLASTFRKISVARFAPAGLAGHIAEELPRRGELLKYGGNALLRFGNEYLPYLKFYWEKNKIEISGVNAESFGPARQFREWEGDFNAFELTIGKNFYLTHNFDLNLEAVYAKSKLETLEPGTDSRIVEQVTDNFRLLSQLTFYFETNTLKLNLFTSFSEIDREEGQQSPPLDFDDTFNGQGLSFRLSLFGLASDLDNPSRFRGRRSTHYEMGFVRNEREFENSVIDLDYRPFVQMELFGLIDGKLDLIMNYNTWIKKQDTGSFSGLYEAHQFQVTPSWVFMYNLYEDTFTNGIEFLSVGVPLQYTIGETAGSFSRLNAGIKLDTQYVVRPGLRIIPTIEGDFAWYPELERTDWGLFAKCIFRY